VLRELHISGLGVIVDLDLELAPGLNVLTGETGTGKTMVTVGLALALGRRGSATLVRSGADAARVEARFDATERAVEEGWADAGELVLARSISADGRSTARAGGRLAPVSTLAELAADLVEVHGQHEGARLRSGAEQTAFLDRFAGVAHLETLETLRAEHERLREGRSALTALRERARDREREIDLLAYQIREIEAAGLRAGEREELRLEEARLSHAERLLERAAAAERTLAADGGAVDGLGRAAADLRAVAELDPGAGDVAALADGALASAQELAHAVRAYRDRLELDPARLEEVHERIAALAALLRKYGEREEDVIAFLDEARGRLRSLEGAGEEATRLEAEVARRTERVDALAATLTTARTKATPRLSSALEAELRELGMPDARVELALVPNPEIGSSGAERVELRFAGGAGQPMHALARVASGGELSRAMLACRSVLVDLDDVPTLVFDEIDAGIGGRAGVAVGRRLAAIAAARQVLVVTHLPQIASFADRHVRVDKHGGAASVEVLGEAGRVAELTRMLAGMPGSDAAATHAEELIAEAGRAKATR
jgi:DNA repair protein RecN (Recombination protein N)